jgi:hypothetical protein
VSITLGTVPENLTVVLTKDADFFTTLQNADGNWSVTAEIKLIFSTGDEWDATISGEEATFNVDSTTVNTLLEARPIWVKLFYIDGTTEICWAKGEVSPNG